MTPTHANVFLKNGCAILGATAHRWPNAYQMLSRQVIATYNLSSCINTALAEINLELIQLFALRWECRPTILAKCGDVGWVGAGKRRAKGCGSGLLQGGGADGFDAAGDLRRCWRLGFRMQRPLRRFAQVRCPISLIAWGVRTRLKGVAGRPLRLPFSDSARPRSAMVGGLSRGGADKVLTYVFSRAILHVGKIIER